MSVFLGAVVVMILFAVMVTLPAARREKKKR